MKHLKIILILFLTVNMLQAQDIKLIIRGDDIGSSHAANIGCIESYTDGIMTSVEIMPPCPLFLEAVKMLNENPKLDVGIHLTLTAEWDYVKWRPLTHVPNLVDDAGNFFSMVWKNEKYPPGYSIAEADWTIEEIEQELRAQIEMSLKHLPQISHISSHMGFTGLDPKIGKLVDRLAKEYDLYVDMTKVKRFPYWKQNQPVETRIDQFCENLKSLEPGTYLFVEHPAKDFPEMEWVGHIGSGDIAKERDMVTQVFTSEKVKQIIKDKGIQLISYADYKKMQN